tara:strand:- start:201 stop:383 length:183 start_codon:yes stop_codon:yes gene_type:complete
MSVLAPTLPPALVFSLNVLAIFHYPNAIAKGIAAASAVAALAAAAVALDAAAVALEAAAV